MQMYVDLLIVLSSVFSKRLKFIYSLDHIVDKKEHPYENRSITLTTAIQKIFRAFSNKLIVIYLSFPPTPSIVFSPYGVMPHKVLMLLTRSID